MCYNENMKLDKLYLDKNLLRNYKKVPLKRFEQISKEDLEYLYITLNLSNAEICTFLGRNRKCIEKYCKLYGLQKSAEQRNLARQKTVQEKYGVLNISQSVQIKDKKIQTSKEHYGTNNPMQSDVIKSKLAQTMLDSYGVDNYAKSLECQEKYRQTCLDRYGVDNVAKQQEIITKMETTCLKKYGVKNVQQNKSVREKSKKTCMTRYKNSTVMGSEHFKEKVKQTNLEKYGVENIMQTEEMRQYFKSIKPQIVSKIKAKLKQTQQKSYETKKRNHSFNTSSPENIIYEKLLEKFKKVLRQYKSEEYPFACDFYIPEIDLYIEFQGNWTHGGKPYNEKDEEDIKLLEEWQEKAKTSKFYQNAIKVWTISDVKKRELAQKRNLNWLEFFTLEEFEEWINELTT